jgi:hypothetical protein
MAYLLPQSLNPSPEQQINPLYRLFDERRSKARYPLDLALSFRTLEEAGKTWEGQVVNISSGGVLVVAEYLPKVGSQLEVRIAWPTLLDDRVPLQLIALGKVVRRGPLAFALFFRQHQFRTLGGRSKLFAQ